MIELASRLPLLHAQPIHESAQAVKGTVKSRATIIYQWNLCKDLYHESKTAGLHSPDGIARPLSAETYCCFPRKWALKAYWLMKLILRTWTAFHRMLVLIILCFVFISGKGDRPGRSSSTVLVFIVDTSPGSKQISSSSLRLKNFSPTRTRSSQDSTIQSRLAFRSSVVHVRQ
jgi:hypothetical protein